MLAARALLAGAVLGSVHAVKALHSLQGHSNRPGHVAARTAAQGECSVAGGGCSCWVRTSRSACRQAADKAKAVAVVSSRAGRRATHRFVGAGGAGETNAVVVQEARHLDAVIALVHGVCTPEVVMRATVREGERSMRGTMETGRRCVAPAPVPSIANESDTHWAPCCRTSRGTASERLREASTENNTTQCWRHERLGLFGVAGNRQPALSCGLITLPLRSFGTGVGSTCLAFWTAAQVGSLPVGVVGLHSSLRTQTPMQRSSSWYVPTSLLSSSAA